ncbi:hypothetical protein NDU88_006819 [Pleurodeles waltl]|uniref:Uncharacterized protein n=1 Tax=Pleurodeles waltl TaxID=8319 RepID=A0AAV7VQP7_PLEWA|nr:hypothetical protein NDU88_006819 [Pleurodeles waltl]
MGGSATRLPPDGGWVSWLGPALGPGGSAAAGDNGLLRRCEQPWLRGAGIWMQGRYPLCLAGLELQLKRLESEWAEVPSANVAPRLRETLTEFQETAER